MRVLLASLLLPLWITCIFPASSSAHFAMIIPSADVVQQGEDRQISLTIQFTHPFEGGPQMQMDKPEKFGVVVGNVVTNLTDSLVEKKVDGKSTWEATYTITRPGDHIFFVIPKPYWEPSEDKFILHVTKVIVDGLGAQDSWDEPTAKSAGLPVEIVPLSRPYGLYAGNVFTGQVLKDGKPQPNVVIEVEWWGKGKTKAPTEAHARQLVKTDANGVFSYGIPKQGWWGFSAIMEGPEPIMHEGKPKRVEMAPVMWIRAYEMQ